MTDPTDEWPGRLASAIVGLWSASSRLVDAIGVERVVESAVQRGFFRPAEDELLAGWFARFLTVRSGLWEVIAEASERVGSLRHLETPEGDTPDGWRGFIAGYAAACVIVRLDRYLVESLATDSITQRKLNEAAPELRIPRKQYTEVFESLTAPDRTLQMWHAMTYARRNRGHVDALLGDALVGPLVEAWDRLEAFVDASKRSYLRRLWKFSEHALRRAGASARQQVEFDMLERSGRAVSEVRDTWSPKRVSPLIRKRLSELLRPGDMIFTRHEGAFTNLFLPGYWPHAALFVGDEHARDALGVTVDPIRRARWSGDRCVLEALKDGVRFRPLAETLGVDSVAVVRPRVDERTIAEALRRAAVHDGKGYNFDFDFFRSDRLVCTEVIYRAYDGLAGLELPLVERGGRPALAAEDLLDIAIDAPERFDVVAIYDPRTGGADLLEGGPARTALISSYRA